MKFLWIWAVGYCIFVTSIYGQQDGKQYCQQVVQCYEDARKLFNDCQSQQSQKPTNATAGKNDCKAATKEKTKQLKDQQDQHRQQIIDCLKSRVNEAMPVSGKQAARCQGATNIIGVSGNGNGINGGLVGSGNGLGGSGGSGSGSGGGSVNSGSGGSGFGSNGNANGIGNANANSNGNVVGTGPRVKRQNGMDANTQTEADDGGDLRAKVNGNGNGRRRPNKKPGRGNGCMAQVNQKMRQCKLLASCCSEVQYCNLKYELSTLHDQIHQTQLDILVQRRQCQKQQQSQTQGASSAKPVANFLRDDPEDEDVELMEKRELTL